MSWNKRKAVEMSQLITVVGVSSTYFGGQDYKCERLGLVSFDLLAANGKRLQGIANARMQC